MALEFSRIDAVLFDIDGTLRDTDNELVDDVQSVLGKVVGAERSRAWSRGIVLALEAPVQALLGIADRANVDGPLNHVIDLATPRGPTRVIPEAQATVRALHGHVPMGVVSAGPQRQVLRFLTEHGLFDAMDVVVTSQTYRRTKPSPEPVLGALRTLGVAPDRAVMVGDTTVDVKAGAAAGCQTFGVLTGFGREKDLAHAGADLIAETMTPLLDGLRSRLAPRP